MITLSPVTFIMVYLGATLMVIFGVWLSTVLATKKRVIVAPKEQLCLCEYCHFVYLADLDHKVNACPQCKTLNKNNVYHP